MGKGRRLKLVSLEMLSISNNSANLIQNNVKRVTIKLEDSLKSVASGRRINSAKDDASGLAISQRLASEQKSNIVSLRNAADTQSFLDTADGAIDETGPMLGEKQEDVLRIVKSCRDFGISQIDIIQLLQNEGKSALAPNISRDLKKLEGRQLVVKKGSVYFPLV